MKKHSESRQWAKAIMDEIHGLLEQRDYSLTSGPIVFQQLCTASSLLTTPVKARKILEDLESLSELRLKAESAEHTAVLLSTRRLYSDSRLLHSLLDLWDPDAINTPSQWEQAVTRLDMAIIVSGAPGENRLDLILNTIKSIQRDYLYLSDFFCLNRPLALGECNTPVHSLTVPSINSVPCLAPPSLSGFTKLATQPFILKGFLKDWPALQDHPWKSPLYLLHVSGRGRVVPVEVGSDYRAESWEQKIMPWELFLLSIGMISSLELENAGFKITDKCDHSVIYYLAQHTLLTQFPELRSDIIIPDYVYTTQSAPAHFPNYRPPGNEEQLVINAWLGPKGTSSPAHTDPYFNCYAQVVGRKTVWLASPEFQREMYPFSDPHAPHTAKTEEKVGDNSTGKETKQDGPSMSNTSRVEVFSSQNPTYPLFDSIVRPRAVSAILEPGDMLFIPPGWWHAMRSEEISFSVSMWF